jgi:hypothetical protein
MPLRNKRARRAGIARAIFRIVRELFLAYGPAAAIVASFDRRDHAQADGSAGSNLDDRAISRSAKPPIGVDASAFPNRSSQLRALAGRNSSGRSNLVPFVRDASTRHFPGAARREGSPERPQSSPAR